MLLNLHVITGAKRNFRRVGCDLLGLSVGADVFYPVYSGALVDKLSSLNQKWKEASKCYWLLALCLGFKSFIAGHGQVLLVLE